MVLSLIVIRNKGCSNLLRVLLIRFVGVIEFSQNMVTCLSDIQTMVINKYSELVDVYFIYVLCYKKTICTESSFPNCSFKTGLGFEAMLSTYICMHKIIYNVEPRKSLYVYIRAQNVVLHCLTLSSFTCLLWYDLFGV